MTIIEIIERNIARADRRREGRSRHAAPWATPNFDRDTLDRRDSLGAHRAMPTLDPTTDLLMPL